MNDCVFCKIVKGEIPSYKVWEDGKHIAFLSIIPEVEGMTIVIPKKHYSSYIVEVDDQIILDLMKAVKKVAKLLDTRLDNVLRTKVVFEGVEVDHLHAKLYPMYRGGGHIPGKIQRADDKELERIADIIRD